MFSFNCPVRQNNWTTVSTPVVYANISTKHISFISYLSFNKPKSLARVAGLQETYTNLLIFVFLIASITLISNPFRGGSITTQSISF